jgi:hypothetical protein
MLRSAKTVAMTGDDSAEAWPRTCTVDRLNHQSEETNMRRSPDRTLIGLLACGLFLSIATQPAVAQTAPADVIKLSSSTESADHRALATRYRAHATEHEADAALHDALVADLKARIADDEVWDLARDAAHYAQHSREAAEALRDLAQQHEAIADRLGSAERGHTPPAGSCCGQGMADKTKGMADKKAPTPAEPGHAAH